MKKNLKVISVIALLAILVVACAPAATQAPVAPAATQAPAAPAATKAPAVKAYKVGYTSMDITNEFFKVILDTITTEVQKRGGTVVHIDAKSDQIIQNQAIEDMITQKIDALILVPYNRESVQPALEALKKAGIPVVNVDSAVKDLTLVKSYISSNNYQAGFILGKEMIRLNPNGGKLAMFTAPTCESCTSRYQGIMDAIKGSGIKVVEKVITSVDKVVNDTEDFIQANPDLTAMFGINDPIGMMMLGVVQSAKLQDKIKVYGIDGAPSCKQSIAEGGMTATSAQRPQLLATMAVDFVYKLLAGETVPALVPVDTVLINKANVAEFGLKGWQ